MNLDILRNILAILEFFQMYLLSWNSLKCKIRIGATVLTSWSSTSELHGPYIRPRSTYLKKTSFLPFFCRTVALADVMS